MKVKCYVLVYFYIDTVPIVTVSSQLYQISKEQIFFISVALSYCNIMDKELLEPIGHHVSLFFVGSITNVGHQVLALEATAYSVVNTLGFTPVRLKQKMYYSCGHLITET